MEWEFIIKLVLGIAGAAMIAGGIVAYRSSERAGVRTASAAAVAAGIVMWAAIVVTTSITTDTGGAAGAPFPTVVIQGR